MLKKKKAKGKKKNKVQQNMTKQWGSRVPSLKQGTHAPG